MSVQPPISAGAMYRGFIWRRAWFGVFSGVIIGIVARIAGDSSWWWLAVPLLAIVFGMSSDHDRVAPTGDLEFGNGDNEDGGSGGDDA